MTEVLVDIKTIQLRAYAPWVLQSCVILEASTPTDPGTGEPVTAPPEIWAPIAPGVTEEALPTIQTIVDDSPSQIIGCIYDATGDPQAKLGALFPTAIAEDGVIERLTNDIWVLRGGVWVNVGPTPGPRIVIETVIKPWNEQVNLEAGPRTFLEVESFPYGFAPIVTDVVVGVVLNADFKAIKKVVAPQVQLQLSSTAPSFGFAAKVFGKVVHVESYNGTDPIETIIATPWDTSMLLLRASSFSDWLWFTKVRNNTSAWRPRYYASDFTPNANSVTFLEDGISLNSATTNLSGINEAYIFRGTKDPVVNNNGSTQSLVYQSTAFNIVTYVGNGSSASIGHGLGTIPELMIIRSVSGTFNSSGLVAGSALGGAGYYMFISSTSTRSTTSSYVNAFDSQTFSIGGSSEVNSSSIFYECYAFKSVANQCKVGSYTGNGLTGGQFIDCDFSVGVVLIKSRSTTSGDWVWINRWATPQGNAVGYFNSYNLVVSTSPTYQFEDDGFRVFDGASSRSSATFLNTLGTDYIYVAMAAGFYRKILCDPINLQAQALAPTIAAGVRIDITAIEMVLLSFNPPYAGIRAAIVPVRLTDVSLDAMAPLVNAGVRIDVPVVSILSELQRVAYAGEVTEEGLNYVAIVASRDGQPLEESAKGSAYRLIKNLKLQGLWDSFATVCPICIARTISGALVPLRGTFAAIPTLSNFSYNRRTGIIPINTSAAISLNLLGLDLAINDNHLSAYVNQLNTYSGGDLIGDGFTTSSTVIGRRTAVSGFETRNKNSTTNTTASPHWSSPSLVGIARSSSVNYQVRAARSTRTVTSGSSTTLNFRSIRLFNFWYGTGNFRVPFYSMGTAVDLEALETVVDDFLVDLKERGLPDTRISPGLRQFVVTGVNPWLAGRFRILVKAGTVDSQLQTLPPAVNTGVAIQAGSKQIQCTSALPLYIGGEPYIANVSTAQLNVTANQPLVATGVSVAVPMADVYSLGSLAPALVGDPLIKVTGRILSYTALSGSSPESAENPDNTTAGSWQAQFGNIQPYQPTPPLWGFTDTNGAVIGFSEGIFNHFRIGWSMDFIGSNGCWMGDTSNVDMEFQTAAGTTIAAVRVICNEGNFRNGLYYGPSLASLTKTGQTGSDPKTGGILTSTATQLIFTNTRVASGVAGSGYNNSWTFDCDMTQVRRIRFTNVSVDSNWTGGVCSAVVRLAITGYTAP